MVKNIAIRTLVFVCGLFIMSVAVALSVKANLGVSPISCIPYIFSERYPLTLGEMTIIFNVFLIILQILLLRKRYNLIQLVQIPVVFLFGFFTDYSMLMLKGVVITGYFTQMIFCLLGCAILAVGVFLEVKAKISYLPGEGVAQALADVTGHEFSKCKIFVDCSMVAVGALFSVIYFSELKGSREGTIIAALLVGYLVRVYAKHLRFVDKIVHEEQTEPFPTKEEQSLEV